MPLPGLAATLEIAQVGQIGQVLSAFWRGSVGTEYAILSATLVRATPLIFTGLAVALAFRAGVLNIGAEGQFLAGATGAAIIGALVSAWSASRQTFVGVPIALVTGGVFGAGWAGIAAWLKRRFGVLEVISTIMLNFVALEAVGYLVRGPLQEPLGIYPQTPTLPPSLHLPVLIPGTRLHFGFAIAVFAAVASWWALRTTAWGFRLRVAGASPSAAASAGQIDVARVATRAFLLSGALAGLAGAVEVTGVAFALYENISPGYGYTAIAVALLANLDPLAVVASGILFGALEAGAGAMQRDAGVPSVVVSVVEAAIVLAILGAQALRASQRRHGSISAWRTIIRRKAGTKAGTVLGASR
jgi:simple sugar transport system permease protein